jgi:hypothetical protein
MDEVVKKDILVILSKLIEILRIKEERDAAEIKELSNHTMHNASIFQDEDSISIAILIYALSKIIERRENEIDCNPIIKLIKEAKEFIDKNNFYKYRNKVKNIFDFISSIDSKLKLYIVEVIKQAQIKKGSKLYAHGISSARAAEILGISQWELVSYIGKTQLTNVVGGVSVRQRLNYARGLFK